MFIERKRQIKVTVSHFGSMEHIFNVRSALKLVIDIDDMLHGFIRSRLLTGRFLPNEFQSGFVFFAVRILLTHLFSILYRIALIV